MGIDVGAMIYGLLANDAGVAGLVGARIYPEAAPDEADLPLVVYRVSQGEAETETAPLRAITIEAHAWADDDMTCGTLAEAIHQALEGATAHSNGVRLSGMGIVGYREERDADLNVWGRLMTYEGQLIGG